MDMFEWMTIADRSRIVEPGKNSITRPNSYEMRWPPLLGSNLPRAVIAQRPSIDIR